MNIDEIEQRLLGHVRTETYTYDYPGSSSYWGSTPAHKKGDTYQVEMDDWYHWHELYDPIHVPGLGTVFPVEDFGGDGMGGYTWFVLRIEPEDGSAPFLVRKEGYYASYDGSTWDGDFAIVEPREKMITVYEEV